MIGKTHGQGIERAKRLWPCFPFDCGRGILLGVCLGCWHFSGWCLSRWHFAWRVLGSLAFCWEWVRVGVYLGRWYFVFGSLAFFWACVWVVDILLGVFLGRWHFDGWCLGRWHFSG